MEEINDNQRPNQNYLVLAIVATIFGCCSYTFIGLVLGVIAIIFAAQVNSKFNSGQIDKAYKYAGYAKKLSLAAIAITVLSLCYVFYQVKTNPEKYNVIYEQFMEAYEKGLKEGKASDVEVIPQSN